MFKYYLPTMYLTITIYFKMYFIHYVYYNIKVARRIKTVH